MNEYSIGRGALKFSCPTTSPMSFSKTGNLDVAKYRPGLSSNRLDATSKGSCLGDDKTMDGFLLNSSLKWSNLFGRKPNGRSSSPPVAFVVNTKTREYSILVSNCIVEKSVSNMDMSLLGKFVGLRPHIELVYKFSFNCWRPMGQVDMDAMAKGFFNFTFNYEDDLLVALTGGP